MCASDWRWPSGSLWWIRTWKSGTRPSPCSVEWFYFCIFLNIIICDIVFRVHNHGIVFVCFVCSSSCFSFFDGGACRPAGEQSAVCAADGAAHTGARDRPIWGPPRAVFRSRWPPYCSLYHSYLSPPWYILLLFFFLLFVEFLRDHVALENAHAWLKPKSSIWLEVGTPHARDIELLCNETNAHTGVHWRRSHADLRKRNRFIHLMYDPDRHGSSSSTEL